jgi:hypothetical protein
MTYGDRIVFNLPVFIPETGESIIEFQWSSFRSQKGIEMLWYDNRLYCIPGWKKRKYTVIPVH